MEDVFVKRKLKIIAGVLALLVVLAAGVILVLRFGFGIDVFDRSGWHETRKGGVQYRLYDGTPLSGWQTIEGGIYYFDPQQDDTAVTGWQTIGGHRYYMGTEGKAAVGWTVLEGDRYFFGNTGVMADGWLEQNGQRYWLGENGVMRTGWAELPEGRYYLDGDGVMQTGWLDLPEGRYYLREDGAMHTGWLELDTGRHYLDENGVMQTGWTELSEGTFWLGEDGIMQTGWLELDTGRYWLSDSGAAHQGWLEQDGAVRYFGDDYAMHIGWLELDGVSYYFSEDGVMQTGWLELDGKTWLLTETGVPYTGWLEDEKGRRWFREDGVMALGRAEVDGVTRWFDSRGYQLELVNPWNFVPEDYEVELVYVEGRQIAAQCSEALKAMMAACRAAGLNCSMTSAYRTHAYQTRIWTEQVERYVARGYSRARAEEVTSKSIAVPGTSEHQLGLAVDLTREEATYAWLNRHSWEYGFIMRYPFGKTELTGIYYEPWHFRYVGKELAKELYDLGLCLEEYMNMLTEQAGYEPVEEAA